MEALVSAKLMVGIHATPGTIWGKKGMHASLVTNLKVAGCLHLKMQATIDDFSERDTVSYLKHSVRGAFVLYDPKFKDAANTMARHVQRFIEYGVDMVTVWIDESGLPEVQEMAVKNPTLIPYLCGVVELTTTPLSVTKKAHGCERTFFMSRQVKAAANFGMSNFICAVPDASSLRKLKLPAKTRLLCPGLRDEGDDPGGQDRIATFAEAKAADIDIGIVERSIVDAVDPREAYLMRRSQLE